MGQAIGLFFLAMIFFGLAEIFAWRAGYARGRREEMQSAPLPEWMSPKRWWHIL